MKRIIHILLATALLAVTSCSKDEKKESGASTAISEQDKQLNITVLLDLSDRIDPEVVPEKPEHYQRDIAVINELISIFKKDMDAKGGHRSKGKFKVISSPNPQDPNINKIASELNVDLSQMEIKEKKKVFDEISDKFRKNLESIYTTTIKNKQYIGSDIWRFFKNDVKDYCVSDDKNYKNILVILTDGYIYHEDSKEISGNRSSYLLPSIIQQHNLRAPDWKDKMQKGDIGFITPRNDLEDLQILVLEVTPSKANLADEDIIKEYFNKWFKEMKVKKYEIYNTDLPEHTKIRIEKFFK
ncbi:hypothetical protein [Bergeyella cardium]|uniref:Uncharacterized protein n=1 Tax=Bergeyella cardium TaxID=1585976 RepID=A0A6P1QUJ7_9FLAO|nr:hypothetical protein [Bergeyella cardium]QHN65822.1 hypothetical protein DBX24_07990 [Bergeyella cardium]WHE33421.1 hypothetical protein P8603_08040 [Bergeyella cardium]WHF60071.1 hypothetical protein O0R51_08035 [Bergeyella cardium]